MKNLLKTHPVLTVTAAIIAAGMLPIWQNPEANAISYPPQPQKISGWYLLLVKELGGL